jgi:exodeoxyribonuclease III
MALRVVSWNINSLRHRIGVLARLLRKYEPDVVCLQETKVPDELFPRTLFDALGYRHVVYRGQKGYHGVCVASRVPFAQSFSRVLGRTKDARHVAVVLPGEIELHNFYVPAGGPDPDPLRNPKFAAKLRYLRSTARWLRSLPAGRRLLVGDLNVAPLDTDVWSHEKLRRVVTHTPIEIAHLGALQRSQRWVDVARAFVPPDEQLFTWWSYRGPLTKGRRLDHVWASPDLGVRGFGVASEVRSWRNPSDHAPLWVELA